MNGQRIRWAALSLVALATGPLHARDGLAQRGDAPDMPDHVRFDQKIGDKVPVDLPFIDENGHVTSLKQKIDGKPTILIMAYYRCPMLCGEVMAGVLDAVRQMPRTQTCGREFNIVCVSFDPKEKPGLALAKKRYFVTEYGRKEADWGWSFLTGQQENIDQLLEATGCRIEFDKSIKEYNHPAGIIILSPEGIISRYMPGIEFVDRGENGQLLDNRTRTLWFSLVEASEGQVGTPTDRAFLSCYRYNPHTGKYSADVMMLMRIGGVFTLLCIAGVYAWKSWQVPGVRVLVVGLGIFIAMIPVFRYEVITKTGLMLMLGGLSVAVAVVGRWMWVKAKANGRPVAPVVN